MTTAWISGHAGEAIVQTEKGFYRCRADGSEPVECSAAHLRALLQWGLEVEEVARPEMSPAAVQSYLSLAWRRERAFALSLVALDPRMPENVRSRSAALASGHLEDLRVRDAVVGRLYGHAAPGEMAPIDPGLALADVRRELEEARGAISFVLEAWEEAERRSLLDRPVAERLRADVVRAGGFRAAAAALLLLQPQILADWHRQAIGVGPARCGSEESRQVGEWVARLDRRMTIRRLLGPGAAPHPGPPPLQRSIRLKKGVEHLRARRRRKS